MDVRFKVFDESRPYFVPQYHSEGASGLDLCSAETGAVVIPRGETVLIGTNLIVELPQGFEAQVRPRSGLALKYGITVLNSPGTVDSDYRGEIKVLLINNGRNDFILNCGDRMAQLVIARYEKINPVLSSELSETTRGVGGYGSTGVAGNKGK